MRKGVRKANAFTLIEVLLAVSLAALLLAVVYGSYAVTVGSVEDAREWVEICQMSRSALDCLTREIESTYFYSQSPYSIFRGEATEVGGAHHSRLTFVTSFPGAEYDREASGGLREASCFLGESEEADEGWVLYHRVDFPPDDDLEGGGQVVPLARRLAGLSLLYWDGVEWRKEWDAREEGALPRLVRVEIAFLGRGGESISFSTMASIPASQ